MKHLSELEIRRALADHADGQVLGHFTTQRDKTAFPQQIREAKRRSKMYLLEASGACLGQSQGSHAMVTPQEEIQPGDMVVVVPRAGSILTDNLPAGCEALGKVFLGRTDHGVVIATLNPPAAIEPPFEDIEALHRIEAGPWLERLSLEELRALTGVAQHNTHRPSEPINPEWRPGAAHLSAFTGEQMSRYATRDLVGAVSGPTFELVNQIAQLSGAVSNASMTQADVKKLRQMLPFQNLFYLRRLFNAVEEGVNDLAGIPKTRRR